MGEKRVSGYIKKDGTFVRMSSGTHVDYARKNISYKYAGKDILHAYLKSSGDIRVGSLDSYHFIGTLTAAQIYTMVRLFVKTSNASMYVDCFSESTVIWRKDVMVNNLKKRFGGVG